MVGSSSVRRTRSLRWRARLVEEEKTTASAKTRLQGMIAASRILRPKFFDPIVVGLGAPHDTSAPKPGSLVTHPHRIVKAHLVALPPVGIFAVVRV